MEHSCTGHTLLYLHQHELKPTSRPKRLTIQNTPMLYSLQRQNHAHDTASLRRAHAASIPALALYGVLSWPSDALRSIIPPSPPNYFHFSCNLHDLGLDSALVIIGPNAPKKLCRATNAHKSKTHAITVPYGKLPCFCEQAFPGAQASGRPCVDLGSRFYPD